MRRLLPELAFVVGLLLLLVLFFWPVLVGGKTLLPFDNLYAFEPWASFAAQQGITVPHNALLSDLILENYAWKHFIVESLQARSIPLWNPYLFAGVPFLAAGQHSAIYPLSVLYYVLPLAQAYGYFTVLQLLLAGLFLYIYLRVLGSGRFGAAFGAVTWTFSGFMLVDVVFPMIIAAASWLPLVLTAIELIVREEERDAPSRMQELVYALFGAIAIGLMFLAGHAEIAVYVALVTAFYAACRLVILVCHRRVKGVAMSALWLAAMVGLGAALGAVQLIPLYELVTLNFRQGSVSYSDVIGWAYPLRQAITFFVPDFFGNPSHHGYFDLLSGQWIAATRDFAGRPIDTIFWGIKNYVEGTSYVGILPLLLALIAIIASFRPPFVQRRYVFIFAALAILSLLFAFGTPLYAILYYGLPGYQQLHTPFRWIFPYTLSIAILAGIGADALKKNELHRNRIVSLISLIALCGGLLSLVLLGTSLLFSNFSVSLATRFLESSDLAQHAFDSGRMLFLYEFRNLAVFAVFLALAGAVVLLGRSRWRWWPIAALVVLVADLWVFGHDFNPAADPRLADFVPPSVEFLQQDRDLFRLTSLDQPNERLFNPNVGMYYGISDVRGYDSIIPKQYAEFMSLIEPQGMLLYNRIAPLFQAGSLYSRLLDLLNVKYVLTTQEIVNPGYTLVYDGEIRIYRNNDVLPRAFVVYRAEVITDKQRLLAEMKSFDPREVALLEADVPQQAAETGGAAGEAVVSIVSYTPSEVVIDVTMSRDGWLVLADSYFPGWLAYTKRGDADEQEIPIYKADYNFRAVRLDAGRQIVRFKYSPMSFRLGLYTSFLAAVVVLIGLAYWLWQRFYREEEGETLRRVLKNSLTPMATSLLNKVIDFAFALLMLRLLGPTNVGRFGFAVAVWLLFSVITDFGLGTLMTREVSKDRSLANRYLSNTTIIRLVLTAVSFAPILLLIAIYARFFDLTLDTTIAILVLAVSLVPSNIASSLSYLFNAYERFEYPAAITVITKLFNVSLGLVALVVGWGFVGLAVISLAANIVTMAIFFWLVRSTFFIPRFEFDGQLVRWMVRESYPLMINNLLSTLFFRIDVLFLRAFQGDTVVGWYNAAYRYIDGVNFIPSSFTLAIFPLLSRYAESARDTMLRAYTFSLKALLIIGMPLTVGTTFIATELIILIGGSAYLPDSAIALSILIWFLPFSFINSVTQYVLIALKQQRFLTLAFLIGVAFNVVANLIFIPRYSYVAASVITVLSEIVLLMPFYYSVRKNLASIPFLQIAWRPVVASVAMGLFLWWQRGLNVLVLVPAAAVVYLAALVVLGTFGEEERAVLRRLVPLGRQRDVVMEAPDSP